MMIIGGWGVGGGGGGVGVGGGGWVGVGGGFVQSFTHEKIIDLTQ